MAVFVPWTPQNERKMDKLFCRFWGVLKIVIHKSLTEIFPTGGCLALSYRKGTPPPSSIERNFFIAHHKIFELPGRSGLVLRLEGSSPRQGIFCHVPCIILFYTSVEKAEEILISPPKRHGMSVLHTRKKSLP